MEHFYEGIKGHCNFEYFYLEMVKKYPSGSRFVEIGCFRGRSAAYMAVEIINSKKDIQFNCIDIWEPFPKDHREYSPTPYEDFLNATESVKDLIQPHKMRSQDAGDLFPDKSLDFVFIDGGHECEDVTGDINAFMPKMKLGGTIAGHDYRKRKTAHQGVKLAVDGFFGPKGLLNKVSFREGSVWQYDVIGHI